MKGKYTQSEVIRVENRIVQINNWDIFKPTALDTASLFVNMIKTRLTNYNPKKVILQILNSEMERRFVGDLRKIIALGKYANMKPSKLVAGMI